MTSDWQILVPTQSQTCTNHFQTYSFSCNIIFLFTVEALGGKCLPCIVDIQHEDQVQKAVDLAVAKFGGIDILVNNASAISLTGTEATTMKKYDLMSRVNSRGTFLWFVFNMNTVICNKH